MAGAHSVPWTQACMFPESLQTGPARPEGGLALTVRSCPPPLPLPRAPLTALAGGPALGSTLIEGLLLAVVVFICFAVSARTGTDAALKGPAAQHLSTVQGTARTVSSRGPPSPPALNPMGLALMGSGLRAQLLQDSRSPASLPGWCLPLQPLQPLPAHGLQGPSPNLPPRPAPLLGHGCLPSKTPRSTGPNPCAPTPPPPTSSRLTPVSPG